MLTKNQKIKKKDKKLNHIKDKIFFAKVRKGNISYKLKLVKDYKVCIIFYILLLELTNTKIFI